MPDERKAEENWKKPRNQENQELPRMRVGRGAGFGCCTQNTYIVYLDPPDDPVVWRHRLFGSQYRVKTEAFAIVAD